MFATIKSKIANWFGLVAEAKPAIPPPANKIKSEPSMAGSTASHRSHSRKKKTAPGVAPATTGKKQQSASAGTSAQASRERAQKKTEKPVKPESLAEVPIVEGKVRFLDLPIHEDIQYGIQNLKFDYCTHIQSLALPVLLQGRDIAGKAQTGTGKTAAFLIAAFSYILNHPLTDREPGSARVLILAPTRELAIQFHKDAQALSVFADLYNVVVFGGMDHDRQQRQLNRPVDILIGTPGRLIDFCRSGNVKLGKSEILIIDEADRMLDMGFIPDVKRIIAQLPGRDKRQTMLFSATLDDNILHLADSWLKDPEKIESEPEQMVSANIEQVFYSAAMHEKLPLLLYIINHSQFDRLLIFGNRKDHNLELQEELAKFGVKAALLSGDIPQEKRLRILEDFRSGKEKIVIATDVAARGIHVDDVSLVINYDLPEHAEDYVHRIGRTGRAGHQGKSISFVCEYGAYSIPGIEELLGQKFPSIWPEDEMLVLPEPVAVTNKSEYKNRQFRPTSGNGKPRKNSGLHRDSRSGYHDRGNR